MAQAGPPLPPATPRPLSLCKVWGNIVSIDLEMGYRRVKGFVTNRLLFTPRLHHTLPTLSPTFMHHKGRCSAPKELGYKRALRYQLLASDVQESCGRALQLPGFPLSVPYGKSGWRNSG